MITLIVFCALALFFGILTIIGFDLSVRDASITAAAGALLCGLTSVVFVWLAWLTLNGMVERTGA